MIGCSGDDTGTPGPGADSGTDTSMNNPDTFVATDSPPGVDTGVDAAPAPKHARIIVVNASPDFGPMRFCFATSTDGTNFSVAPLAALPHTVYQTPTGQLAPPGLYQGTGGALPDISDLAGQFIRGYLIKANSIATQTADAGASEKTCDMLVGTGGSLVKGTDYFQLADIPKGTFAHGTTELVAALGCLPAAQDTTTFQDAAIPTSAARCGPTYDATNGNISASVFTLDTTTAQTASTFGAQTLHASSALDGIIGAVSPGGVVVENSFLVNLGADGGPAPVGAIATGQVYGAGGSLRPDAAAPQLGTVIAPAALTLNGTAYGVQTYDPAPAPPVDAGPDAFVDGGTTGAVNEFAIPLFVVSALTVGQAAATSDAGWLPGENYTFVLLGDPENEPLFSGGALNPAYNGFGVHVIAFPNHIVAPKFQ